METVVLVLEGVRKAVNPLSEEIERNGLDVPRPIHLRLNFVQIEFITSVEVGTLVSLHKRYRECGGRLTLRCVGKNVLEVLCITRLDTVLHIENHSSS